MTSERSFTVDSHSGTMLSQLNKQLMENSFCDVILQVQKKKFSAHRNVLSACSEYFSKMFTIDMKEKHNMTVKFKDIDPKAMEVLLDFLYTEKIVITEDNVSDILHAASVMQIADELYVFGGEKLPIPINKMYYKDRLNPHESNFADNFEVFTENWKVEGKLRTRRSFASAQVFDDKIYLMGGYTLPQTLTHAYDSNEANSKKATNTTDVFNVSTRCWNEGPVMRVARAVFGSTVSKSTIYVVGGLGTGGSLAGGAEFMKPGDGVWTAITGSNWNLNSTSACSLKNQIYLIGSCYHSLYRYDPDDQQWPQELADTPAGSFVIPFAAQNQAG